MNEYIFFMHDDAADQTAAQDMARWEKYLSALRSSGQFDGGSSIGPGLRLKKGGVAQAAPSSPVGVLRFRAESLTDVQRHLSGNPVYEAGGTVEIRELPKD